MNPLPNTNTDFDASVSLTSRIDRPVSVKNLSGVGNFLGIYGGEHIAATEFVFGAVLASWGCPAKDIILGLIIGNILAVLSFTFLCATIATDTRLTLYSYLKKILNPPVQKIYNLVWGLCSIALAAAGMTVSATAIREASGVEIQHAWYPTSISFVVIVLVLGTVVTYVAAHGFEAIAKFSSSCVPWMIAIFFIGAVVSLPRLAEASGTPLASLGDVWSLFSAHIGGKADAPPISIYHVICFAWLCNLAWHAGLNDMGLFRFAKTYKYGYVSTIGMFVGHFFAWIAVAAMGAAAAMVLRTPLAKLDPGAVTNSILGISGLLAVIVAGWTTANPTIYRAALSIQTLMPQFSRKTTTYMVGSVMTLLACLPCMSDISFIVQMLGWATVGVGAICITEHYLFPKIGLTRYWSMYKGNKVNMAALAAWLISVVFVVVMRRTGAMHDNFIFIPQYFIAAIVYLVLAPMLGAKAKYPEAETREQATTARLVKLADEEAESKLGGGGAEKHSGIVRKSRIVSILFLAGLVVIAFLVYSGMLSVDGFKTICLILSVLYFVFSGIATYIQYRSERAAIE